MKNKLLLTVDGIRKERFSCYDHRYRELTPNVYRIGRESLVFEDMVAAATSTGMCFSSIFTGRYNYEFGRTTYADNRNPFPAENLFSDMSKQGYSCFVCLNRRFRVHADLVNAFGPAEFFWTGEESKERDIFAKDRVSLRPMQQAQFLLDKLGAVTGPWFCWLHIWGFSTPQTGICQKFPFEYDARIHEMDQAIGMLFDRLRDHAEIWIGADHGYSFFEQGRWSYGKDAGNLTRNVLEVPFLAFDGRNRGLRSGLISQRKVRGMIACSASDVIEEPYVLAETRYAGQKDKSICVVSPRFKLDYDHGSGTVRFYDRLADLSETTDYIGGKFYRCCRDLAGGVPPKKPFVLRTDWDELFAEFGRMAQAIPVGTYEKPVRMPLVEKKDNIVTLKTRRGWGIF